MSMWGGPNPGGAPPAFGTLPPFCTMRGVHAFDVRQGDVLVVVGDLWAGTGIAYAWQWFRDGVAIAGATAATYTLVAADRSARIQRRTTATNSAGSAVAWTDMTSPVKQPKQAPVAVVNPVILGAAQVGRVMAIGDGQYLNGPIVKRRFGWLRGGVLLTGDADKIGTRTAVPADEGAMLIGRQWIEGPDGVELVIDTAAVGPIAASGGPAVGIAPSIVSAPVMPGGAPEVGVIVTMGAGSYAGSGPIVVARQWQRKLGAGAWSDIAGATTLTYAPVAGDVGYVLRLREIATNDYGNVTAYSGESAVVIASSAGAQYAFTATNDIVVPGSSTSAGDSGNGITSTMGAVADDASGETYYATVAAAPASGGVAFMNAGVGGENATQIAARIVAFPARAKAADAIIQMTGNFTDAGNPADFVGVHISKTQEAVGATGLNHNNFILVPKHHDQLSSFGTLDWAYQRDYISRARALWPGRVQDPSIALRRLTPADATDEANRDNDVQMTSYQFNTGHLNDAGQRHLARACHTRFAIHRATGFPMVPHQRVYSTAATNQTNGGLVANLEYIGVLAGTTFSIVDNANFSVAISGGNLQLLRATGTGLYDGCYHITLRAVNGGRTLDTYLVVYLMDLTGARHGRFRVRKQIGMACAGLMGGLRGVTGQKLSVAVGMKPNQDDAASRRIVNFGGASSPRGIFLGHGATHRLSLVARDAAGNTVISIDTSNLAGQTHLFTAANGLRWAFFTVDLTAGTASAIVDEGSASSGTATVGGTYSIANQLSNSTCHFLFGSGNQDTGSPVIDAEFEAIAMWPDVIDFSVAANRNLVRDAATKQTLLHTVRGADAAGVVNGIAPFLWLQGAANAQAGLNLASGQRIVDVADRWNLPIVNAGE